MAPAVITQYPVLFSVIILSVFFLLYMIGREEAKEEKKSKNSRKPKAQNPFKCGGFTSHF